MGTFFFKALRFQRPLGKGPRVGDGNCGLKLYQSVSLGSRNALPRDTALSAAPDAPRRSGLRLAGPKCPLVLGEESKAWPGRGSGQSGAWPGVTRCKTCPGVTWLRGPPAGEWTESIEARGSDPGSAWRAVPRGAGQPAPTGGQPPLPRSQCPACALVSESHSQRDRPGPGPGDLASSRVTLRFRRPPPCFLHRLPWVTIYPQECGWDDLRRHRALRRPHPFDEKMTSGHLLTQAPNPGNGGLPGGVQEPLPPGPGGRAAGVHPWT